MLNRCVTLLSTIAGFAFIGMISAAHGSDRAQPNDGIIPRAVGDPLKILYRIAGVNDDGGGVDLGIATTFQCANLNNVAETIVIHIRDYNATVKLNKAYQIPALRTNTFSTHSTRAFSEDAFLNTGSVSQGIATIRATTNNIICSAMVVDAAATVPEGIALHLVRFSPIAGSQE